jgi:hypothetical protein
MTNGSRRAASYMKLLNIKKTTINFGIMLLFGGLFILCPQNVEAFIPDVNVRVVNSITGSPVTGVWVMQTNTPKDGNNGWSSFLNNCQSTDFSQRPPGRFVETNDFGIASFLNPENLNESICNIPIDSDSNGTNDVVSFPCSTGVNAGVACVSYQDWSCYGNSMGFQVVPPAGDTGTYTSIASAIIPNYAADMEYTIYYTPSGSTPPPSPSPNLITQTSKKEIGTIAGIGNKFQPLTELEEGKDYWVRIQVFNNDIRDYTKVALHEVLNSAYFDLYQPNYIKTDWSSTTFFIESLKNKGYSEGMEDTTEDECEDLGAGIPSCISGYVTGGNSFIAQPITNSDPAKNTAPMNGSSLRQKYFYFKVRAKANSAGAKIKVDVDDTYPAHTGGYIDFIDEPNTEYNEPGLDNEEVVICPVGGCINSALGYVQILLGNVYSHYVGALAPITFELPLNTALIPEPISTRKTSILFQRDPKPGDYGAGRPVDSNWYLQGYSQKSGEFNYNNLYNEYKDKPIQSENINGVNQLDNGVGYYIDQTSISTGRYTISGGGWKNQTIQNKQAVIFVPGDLFISENVDISSEGNSSLAFIVQGNVGIDPSVTNVEGIFIVDGVIDTTCSASSGFISGKCESTVAPPDVRVTLEGLYYSSGGFVLDRDTGTEPSETFRFRPDFLFSASSTLGKNLYSWVENSN